MFMQDTEETATRQELCHYGELAGVLQGQGLLDWREGSWPAGGEATGQLDAGQLATWREGSWPAGQPASRPAGQPSITSRQAPSSLMT